MRLQTKFLLLGAISILSVLLLVYNAHSYLGKYVEFVDKLKKVKVITQVYAEKNVAVQTVQADVWRAIYYGGKELNDTKQKLGSFLAQDSSKINQNLINILTQDINQNLINLDSSFNNYILKAQAVINAIGRDGFVIKLDEFKAALNEVNEKNDIFNKQLLDFIENTTLKGDALLNESFDKSAASTFFAVILICLVSLFSNFNLFNPLAKIVRVMTLIVHNDRSEEVPFTSRTDEVGEIAKALEIFRSTSIEKEKLEEQAKVQIKKAEEDRHNSMVVFSNQFESSVKGIVDMVALAAKKMDATALELEQSAMRTQEETTLLASNSLKANANMQGVSKATGEFNSSVNEIAIQVNNSLGYASKVVEQADKVSSVVVDLETKASAISGIIDIINGITSQIDLLALNATIEAARAGDMGKGFAVVANEVKALATQTSKATEQINFQISGIQLSTNKAVMSIQEITASVKTINQNSASIVSAVEKQNKTSSYIADSISQVASMSNSVSSGVEKVADSSSYSGKAASQMASAAKDLLKQSEILQSEVDKFLSSLKYT